jgi:hypothetical protein
LAIGSSNAQANARLPSFINQADVWLIVARSEMTWKRKSAFTS